VTTIEDMTYIAHYGIIPLNWKTSVVAYVFSGKVDVVRGYHTGPWPLSDGRNVVCDVRQGVRKLWSSIRPRLNIETSPGLTLGDKINEHTADKIKKEVLTINCRTCKEPTPYEINFSRGIMMMPFGGFSSGYVIKSCLDHINDIVEREDKAWEVYERSSTLWPLANLRPSKIIGRVKHDAQRKMFRPVDGPAPEQILPDTEEIRMGGELIFKYTRNTGLLEIGDLNVVRQMNDAIRQSTDGIHLEIDLPMIGKKTFENVKSVKASD